MTRKRTRNATGAAWLMAAAAVGCAEGAPAGDRATGTSAQAVVNCTRDLRVDPLQAGPAVAPAFGGMQIVTLGQESTRNGAPVIAYMRRTGLVASRWSPSAPQWTSFELAGQGVTRNPALLSVGGGLHAYSLDAGGRLVDLVTYGSGWSSPASIGTLALDSSPAAVLAGGAVRIFARSAETHGIYERRDTSTWVPVGEQQVTSAPAAVAVGNRVVLFARGLDDGLMVKVEAAGVWGPWRRMPAWTHEIISAPSAIVWLNGTIIVHALNPQGALVEAYSTDLGDTWLQGTAHGGVATSSPAAAFDGARIFVVARGSDGAQLVLRPWEGDWRDWQWVGGGTAITNTCAAASAAQVTNDAFPRAACSNGVASTDLCGPSGCRTIARWPCYPWSCDGSRCRTERCSSNADCAGGAQCAPATQTCVPVDYTCKDAFTVVSATGNEASCAPYQCRAGACRGECNDTSDCASGYECRGQKCTPVGSAASQTTVNVDASWGL